ncbi:MAG TPA: GNAT family N-acetyltransferase [Aggregatilineales bacterium]|nr:GNAT family N-acetyltransferase [Aggregatilineales bacterium]
MIPSIETERLLLRPFHAGDADDYYNQIAGDPDVMRFLRGGQILTRDTMDEIIRLRTVYWQDHGFGLWVVTDKYTGIFMGQCGLHMLDKTPEVEIAYAIGKGFWGDGISTEAGRAVLRWGFEEYGMDRIVAVAVQENTASQRVMVKLGMRYEKIAHVYESNLSYYAIHHADFRYGDSFYHLHLAHHSIHNSGQEHDES